MVFQKAKSAKKYAEKLGKERIFVIVDTDLQCIEIENPTNYSAGNFTVFEVRKLDDEYVCTVLN